MLIRMAVKEFLSEKEFENISKSTLRSYEIFFNGFLGWCEENELERIDQLTTRTLKGYLHYMKMERDNNPTSVNTKRKRLKTFFNFLIAEGLAEENPADGIKKLREDIRIKTFSDQEVNEILSHLRRMRRREDGFYSIRNYAMFLTLIGTGLRVGELCSLRWSSIDLQKRTFVVFGKMRRDEQVPLSDRLVSELGYLRDYYRQHFGEIPESVFVNRRGEPLTENGVKCWFKRLAKQMSFPETRCSAHSCRHYFAKTWIQNGGDISTLAKILRHTSIKTTEKYLHFWGNEVADDNDKYNPLNKINF